LGHFLRGPEKSEKLKNVRGFLLFYQFGALAAIHLRWGNGYFLNQKITRPFESADIDVSRNKSCGAGNGGPPFHF